MLTKNLSVKQQYDHAKDLEKEGKVTEAIDAYQKLTKVDPSYTDAWSRLMILLRKLKSGTQEISTIKLAISSYKKTIEAKQKKWVQKNKKKAELSRALAQSLGLLQDNGLPTYQDEIITKWQTRLHLLEHKLANTKPKKKSTLKKTIRKSKTQNSR